MCRSARGDLPGSGGEPCVIWTGPGAPDVWLSIILGVSVAPDGGACAE